MSVSVSKALRATIGEDAGNRCGYCLSPQQLVMGALEIDHICPTAAGGLTERHNLWLACSLCNRFKADQLMVIDPLTQQTVPIFNPRTDRWADHFNWQANGAEISGQTASGRATVVALQLNNQIAVLVRKKWLLAGWHPPID